MTTQQAFVSLDGTDTAGVRAEVYVQKGVGKVTKIEVHANGKTANVAVANPGLKHPVHGYINVSDPIFSAIEEAKASQADVHYRTESQRKRSVDRSTPIAELRKDMATGRENVTNIFAGINGELSQEAVTNPAEDPAPGGRVRAIDQAPTAPAAAEAPATRNSSVSVTEEKPWSELNSDGFPNLGSYAFGAALGIDSFVVRILNEAGADVTSEDADDTIFNVSKDILDIVDYVQVKSYSGHLSRPNRSAGSHAKVRGVVFSVIEEMFPLDGVITFDGIDEDSRSEWKNNVTKAATARIRRALRLGFPDAFGPGTEVFAPRPQTDAGDKATRETIAELRSLATDSKMENLSHLSALLFKTFGTSKAGDVNDADLAAFIQFYGQNGVENLLAVAERAYNDVQSN